MPRSRFLFRRTCRTVADYLLSVTAALGGFVVPCLPARLVHVVVGGIAGLACLLAWPLSDLRRRSAERGIRLSPVELGTCYGRNLAALFGAGSTLRISGWTEARSALQVGNAGRGVVVLSAHLGPWEAGARELAVRGLNPAVVAAPWPRLPRTAAAVARLRARGGVKTFFRGRAGWRGATRHLRAGGSVVVLVDSGRPWGARRRPGAFVDGPVAAPDALVAWAQRQGVALWVAAGRADGFDLQVLERERMQPELVADRALAVLRSAALSQPSQWGWVRALAAWLVMASFVGWGCNVESLPPPLPLQPEAWVAVAEGVQWQGPIPGHGQGRLQARHAEGTWERDAPHGEFHGVELSLWSADGLRVLMALEAELAEGTWPDGPLRLEQVRWQLQSTALENVPEQLRTGVLAELLWRGSEGWSCGGCLLEQLGVNGASTGAAKSSSLGEQQDASRVP